VFIPHNLTVGCPRHSLQYNHYFIRQLSAATCCQFTALPWPTVLSVKWRGQVTRDCDERNEVNWSYMRGLGGVSDVFVYRGTEGQMAVFL